MTESPMSPQAPKESDIDPIAFDDEKVFGLDPAVHWVLYNNQNEQFPEIVAEIVKHWKDRDWLEKLLIRIGYTPDVYDTENNPLGIYSKESGVAQGSKRGLSQLRYFLLKAVGVKQEQISSMFMLDPYSSHGNVKLIHTQHFNNIISRRKELEKSFR